MENRQTRHIGDILRRRNIEIVDADLATRRYNKTQVDLSIENIRQFMARNPAWFNVDKQSSLFFVQRVFLEDRGQHAVAAPVRPNFAVGSKRRAEFRPEMLAD